MIILGAGERHACVVQRIKPERSRRARDPSRPWKKNPAISRAPPRGRLRETTNPRSLPSRRHTSPRSAMSAAGAAMDADDPPSCSASADSGGFEFAAKSAQLAREDARLQVEVRGRHLISFAAPPASHGRDLLSHGRPAPPRRHRGHPQSWLVHHLPVAPLPDLHVHGERLYQDMDRRCTSRRSSACTASSGHGEVRVGLSGGGKPIAPRDETPAAPRTPQIEWESDRYAFKPPPPSQRLGRRGPRGLVGAVRAAGARAGLVSAGRRGAGVDLSGLRGRGVGEMVAQSMKGGDGKAQAMAGGVAARSALGQGGTSAVVGVAHRTGARPGSRENARRCRLTSVARGWKRRRSRRAAAATMRCNCETPPMMFFHHRAIGSRRRRDVRCSSVPAFQPSFRFARRFWAQVRIFATCASGLGDPSPLA